MDMDFEQIVKRLQWLDEEHRKDKAAIIALEERIVSFEGNIELVKQQIKPLDKQIAGLSSTTARIDQFDKVVANQREEMKKALDEIEKKFQAREIVITKQHQKDLEPFPKEIDELRQALTPIAPLQRDIKARIAEEARLHTEINELKPPIDEAKRAAEDVARVQRSYEENRKQDIKRVADLQGELAAMRSRIEEAKSKADLTADSFKNIDNRINEVMLSEAERKAAQNAFIEKQSIAQLDRERPLKDWQEKSNEFQKQVKILEAQSLALEDTLRAAKKAQETYNELNVKLERRINEVTEMQRLAEDRLRQEWVTFKADDQKRWTGYTLSQDEGTKDVRRAVQKLDERIAPLNESIQTLQDQLHQTADATEQQLQELMNVAHEWLSAYERIMGHGKAAKKTKK
jgi:DNA repair exonuclease SbcCD ATPase subunit